MPRGRPGDGRRAEARAVSAGREHRSSGAARAWVLPPGLHSPRCARQLVREALNGWGLGPLAADAALMASELVANAVVHGAPPVALRLVLDGPELTCEVTDSGDRMPAPDRCGGLGEHGRGLAIVAALASGCGMQRTSAGKTAWFVLPVPGPLRGAA